MMMSSREWYVHSLVPRPFWSLAVCQNKGERPGPFYHMNDQKNAFHTVMCSLFWNRSGTFFTLQTSKLQHLGQKLQNKVWSLFFWSGTPPPSVYLGRQNVIHVIQWTKPSRSIFAYCKWSKTGQREGLVHICRTTWQGNKSTLTTVSLCLWSVDSVRLAQTVYVNIVVSFVSVNKSFPRSTRDSAMDSIHSNEIYVAKQAVPLAHKPYQ